MSDMQANKLTAQFFATVAAFDPVDVALAEAAIGAGLTGALLMAALAKLRSISTSEEMKAVNFQHCWLPSVALLLVAAGLGYVVLSLPPYAAGLSAEVTANLDASGVSNPVTAVLLNFRGYDTLLEMVVLLLALLGVWSLGGTAVRREAAPGSVLDTLARVLAPLLILVASYLLWVGAHAPGGAFQAGAVLGAAGVLLLLTGWRPCTDLMALPLRLMLVTGPGLFVAMAALLYMIEGQLLAFPPAQAGILILILETAATVSIGVTLATLFPHRLGSVAGAHEAGVVLMQVFFAVIGASASVGLVLRHGKARIEVLQQLPGRVVSTITDIRRQHFIAGMTLAVGREKVAGLDIVHLPDVFGRNELGVERGGGVVYLD